MNEIKVHVLHTGQVRVSPYLPFGGDNVNIIKASGIFMKDEQRIWLPVAAYLIEHRNGRLLVDTGWHRAMSPKGVFDKDAQVAHLGSKILYRVNQGIVPPGEALDEQLSVMGVKNEDITCLLMTHLDCDHASGLAAFRNVKKIVVTKEEFESAAKFSNAAVRYQRKWWDGIDFTFVEWNGTEGPAGHSYDVFGDGSVVMVHIPGHSDGLCAVKITNEDGKFVLLAADGGYAEKSWKEMILPGIVHDKEQIVATLTWIREQSESPDCIACFATHDTNVEPQVIVF